MIAPVAAAGAVCLRGAEILLVRRATPPRQGEWSIPGGRIQPGETTCEAALRELSEETGVTAEILGLAAVVDAFFSDESGALARHYVLIDYACRWRSGEPKAGDDAAEARFLPAAEAIERVEWDETKRVIAETLARWG